MRAIFVSYRRDDSEGEAGRLFDDLVQEFGEKSVFMDVAAIEVGRDFRKVIDDSVATCGVLLAVIGEQWTDAKNEAGHRRLDDPTDFVRLETASALKRDIPVVPVLVHGARMPRADQLPDDLKELAYRNGVELTHARWKSDVQLLIKALRPYVEDRKGAPSSPSQAVVGGAAVKKAPAPVATTVPEIAAGTASTSRKNLGIILAVVAAVLAVGTVVGYMIIMQKRAAEEQRVTAEQKTLTDKAAADRAAANKAAEEQKAIADKAAADRAAADKALAEEKALADKAAADRAAADRAAAQKAAADRAAAQQKAIADKAAADKAAAQQKAIADKAAADRAAHFPSDFPGGSRRVYWADFRQWPASGNNYGSARAEGSAYVIQPLTNTLIGPSRIGIQPLDGDFLFNMHFRVEQSPAAFNLALMDRDGDSVVFINIQLHQNNVTYSLERGWIKNGPNGPQDKLIATGQQLPISLRAHDWSKESKVALKRQGGKAQFFVNDGYVMDFPVSLSPIAMISLNGAWPSKIVITSVEGRKP